MSRQRAAKAGSFVATLFGDSLRFVKLESAFVRGNAGASMQGQHLSRPKNRRPLPLRRALGRYEDVAVAAGTVHPHLVAPVDGSGQVVALDEQSRDAGETG